MILAYTRERTTGHNYRIGLHKLACNYELEMSGETPKQYLPPEDTCYLCKVKITSEEKIRVFGKSTLEMSSLIRRATEVDLSVFAGSDIAICRTECYNRLLRFKRALTRVEEMVNEIKQDFKNDGTVRVKRLAKEPGPEAKKSLKFGDGNVDAISRESKQQNITFTPVFAFGNVSPIARVASSVLQCPSGLFQNTFGITGQVLTSTPQKPVECQKPVEF